jgi:hypothetical protein
LSTVLCRRVVQFLHRRAGQLAAAGNEPDEQHRAESEARSISREFSPASSALQIQILALSVVHVLTTRWPYVRSAQRTLTPPVGAPDDRRAEHGRTDSIDDKLPSHTELSEGLDGDLR